MFWMCHMFWHLSYINKGTVPTSDTKGGAVQYKYIIFTYYYNYIIITS